MYTMTKVEFIKQVAQDADLTKHDATVAVNAVFDNLKKLLVNGDSFAISRFCTFTPITRAGRNGHSPITGEAIWIEPKKSVKVKLSNAFKAELNNKTAEV